MLGGTTTCSPRSPITRNGWSGYMAVPLANISSHFATYSFAAQLLVKSKNLGGLSRTGRFLPVLLFLNTRAYATVAVRKKTKAAVYGEDAAASTKGSMKGRTGCMMEGRTGRRMEGCSATIDGRGCPDCQSACDILEYQFNPQLW